VGRGVLKTRPVKPSEVNMNWYAFLAYFFAGGFLANGIPHFIHGISGKKFRTPFSKPMTTGESSPVLNGQIVGLTPLEFGVIHYLYQREGKAVSRGSLIENVWGYSYEGGSNVVDTVVLSLRKKLGQQASVIETVRGVGYRFRRV